MIRYRFIFCVNNCLYVFTIEAVAGPSQPRVSQRRQGKTPDRPADLPRKRRSASKAPPAPPAKPSDSDSDAPAELPRKPRKRRSPSKAPPPASNPLPYVPARKGGPPTKRGQATKTKRQTSPEPEASDSDAELSGSLFSPPTSAADTEDTEDATSAVHTEDDDSSVGSLFKEPVREASPPRKFTHLYSYLTEGIH